MLQFSMTAKCCKDLKVLKLYFNPAGDSWLVQLAADLPDWPAMTELRLNDTKMTSVGAKSLAKILVKTPKKEVLYLAGNAIGDEGATAVAEAEREILIGR